MRLADAYLLIHRRTLPEGVSEHKHSPPHVVALGTGEGATFSPWSAGATATVLTAFQGGAMILPTIRVTARPTEGDTLCLHIELRNALSDGSVVLPGVSADFI